ncbi:MAG: DNA topoisomerase III [Oscillospiraceae bacterium]|nr:DNA topoisomerase III [Oscillospiraceae bacterium]
MSKTLVLAEKPSVGRELARVLGCGRGADGYAEGARYVVTWALGHLVTLADPETYDPKYKKWNMDDLPMLPDKMKTVVIKETGKQFRTVQSLMRREDIDELIIATDAGREGELVARWIMEKAGWRGRTRRLWISSQTDKAIKEGFEKLRPASEYDDLYLSALSRSQADWLVGLNVTRALTCRYGASLSAGRVQTPTLAMLAEREEEIKNFVPKPYWTVQAKSKGFSVTRRDKNGQARIFDKESALQIAEKLSGKKATVVKVERTYKNTPPPAAYDLTELQRDANRKYAYTAKETLSLMQSLYEVHKVLTYPRTDSRYISDDVAPTLPERLSAMRFGAYAQTVAAILRARPLQTRFIVNNAKVTDHHAIIPTEEPPDTLRMSGPEMNIYDLVARRFMAVLMPPYEYEELKLTLSCGGETLHAMGRRVINEGWKAAYGAYEPTDETDEGDDEKEQVLPDIRQGDAVELISAKAVEGRTKPPARYTEATLLTAMEHPGGMGRGELSKTLEETGGLGTPATRADIIEKLFSAFYAERNGKSIIPTAKGIQLVGLAPEELRSAALTAKWEKRLGAIARGEERADLFVAEMRKYASRLVEEVKASEKSYVHENVTREKCPECGKFLLEVKGKKDGKMLVCPDRECGWRKSTSVATNARCPNCHKKMELRGDGEKRMFVCICGFREKLSDFEKRREERGAGKADVSRYMRSQKDPGGSTALADALRKWQEENG